MGRRSVRRTSRLRRTSARFCDGLLHATSDHMLVVPEGDLSKRRHAHTECVVAERRARPAARPRRVAAVVAATVSARLLRQPRPRAAGRRRSARHRLAVRHARNAAVGEGEGADRVAGLVRENRRAEAERQPLALEPLVQCRRGGEQRALDVAQRALDQPAQLVACAAGSRSRTARSRPGGSSSPRGSRRRASASRGA